MSVEELLGMGIAALKAGLPANAGEARDYFERVLLADDAEPRQKAKAWLYLSRIETEPARKRACFESALVLDPGNAEARQGLAILDGRLKVEDIADPDKPLPPVIPKSELLPAEAQRLVCPKCAAKLLVKAGAQSPVCVYCGTPLESEADARDRTQIREQDFSAALPTAKARRWENPTERTLRCEGCGATFVLPPLHASGACPFCGSTHVVQQSAAELIQPESLIPFQFDGAEAARYIRQWMDRQRFRPADLAGCAGTIEPLSIFLPFWTFDLSGTLDWRALVDKGRGEHTKWVPETGVHLLYHDDLLVPASRKIHEDLSDAYTDFDTGALIPYAAEYLAGYATEAYQVPLEEASVMARQHALQKAKAYEQKTSLAGKKYRDFIMNSVGMTIDSYKLVLLPIWLANYQYRERTFPVAVNGQTGTVAGRIPRNWWQRALATFFGA